MNKELLESKVRRLTSSLEVFNDNLAVADSFVPPYIGKDKIKLVVIGQDPTVRNPKSRKNVTCTLNLNKQNSALYRYIKRLCDGLGITMENVYATNLFKYFYSIPPANTPEVLRLHLHPNLELLKEELSSLCLPTGCLVITLGEPVLNLLLNQNVPNNEKKVRFYWGYDSKTKKSDRNFRFVDESKNVLSHKFYPFCHQPSMRKQFYKDWIKEYVGFIKANNFITK